MIQLINFFQNISTSQLLDIFLAIVVIILFIIFAPLFSKLLIKMCKINSRDKKSVKENAFYKPLTTVIKVLGIYVAILMLQSTFDISPIIITIANRILLIIATILFAKAFARSFTPESRLIKKLRNKANKEIEDTMLNFILKSIRGIIYVCAGFIVITSLGINLNGLVAGLGIGSVLITLAAQDTAKNLFGGLMIFLDKPFEVGDWIQVDKYEGIVEDITFRSTRVRVLENSLVNIPNAVIANAAISNWSKLEKRRYTTNLKFNIYTQIEKIELFKQKLYDLLTKNDEIVEDSIDIKLNKIATDGVNLHIVLYTKYIQYPEYILVVENINYVIMKLLKDEGIGI